MILSGVDLKALSRIKQDKQLRIANTLMNNHAEIMKKWKNGYHFKDIARRYNNLSELNVENYIIEFLRKEALDKKNKKEQSIPKHQDGFTRFCDIILFKCLKNINKSKREKNDEKFESAV